MFSNTGRKQIVISLEINRREAFQLEATLKQKKRSNYESDSDEGNLESSSYFTSRFKMLESVKNVIDARLNIKVIYFFRSNFYYSSKTREELEEFLKESVKDAQCEIAYSSVDLWFQLRKNIENSDIVHIFSSEKQLPPESAIK